MERFPTPWFPQCSSAGDVRSGGGHAPPDADAEDGDPLGGVAFGGRRWRWKGSGVAGVDSPGAADLFARSDSRDIAMVVQAAVDDDAVDGAIGQSDADGGSGGDLSIEPESQAAAGHVGDVDFLPAAENAVFTGFDIAAFAHAIARVRSAVLRLFH
jgi:hypothetical protein